MSTCRHHWDIETPCGPTSRGRCKRCGMERDFFNSHDGSWVNPSRQDATLIARVKREETEMGRLIHEFGQEGSLPFAAYRRNAQREGAL